MDRGDVVREGICYCHTAPVSQNGLEGYVYKENYKYQLCSGIGGKAYYRVYPEGATYYETCGPVVFKRYFKPLT